MSDFDGEDRRKFPRLSDEQAALLPDVIEHFRKEKAREEAMSSIAIKVRNVLTFLVLLAATFAMFWDQFKSLVQHAKI